MVVIEQIVEFVKNPVVVGAITIGARNVYGWLKNSIADGKITDYEWRQLAETIFRVGGLAAFLYFGIGVVVPGITPESATALSALIDVLKSEFKKK